MKNLLIIALAITLFSCNTNENKTTTSEISNESTKTLNENALLYNKATIRQEINFYPEENKDWKESLMESKLIEKICEGAINGKKVYDYDGKNILNIDEIKTSLGQSVDTIAVRNEETGKIEIKVIKNPYIQEQIKDIFFNENWSMDNDLTNFTKHINKYTLVREYVNEESLNNKDNPENMRISKALTFSVVNNDKEKNYKLIAKNVISEFYFDQEYQSRVEGLNIENLQKIILNKVLSGKTKTYSFNDLSEEISLTDLKEIIGATIDTIEIEDIKTGEFTTKITENIPDPENIIGLIFIEDWLFDEETLMIKKNIIGIAPIWQNIRISDTGDVMESKMIPFVIKF